MMLKHNGLGWKHWRQIVAWRIYTQSSKWSSKGSSSCQPPFNGVWDEDVLHRKWKTSVILSISKGKQLNAICFPNLDQTKTNGVSFLNEFIYSNFTTDIGLWMQHRKQPLLGFHCWRQCLFPLNQLLVPCFLQLKQAGGRRYNIFNGCWIQKNTSCCLI